MMTSAPTYGPAGFPTPADVVEDAAAAASLRLAKRPGLGLVADTCKKRRKQATPIRISTSGAEDILSNGADIAIGTAAGTGTGPSSNGPANGEGKLGPFLPSPTHSPLAHVKLEPMGGDSPAGSHAGSHTNSPAGSPVNLSGGQNFPAWMSDVPPKADEWLQLQPAFGAMYVPHFGQQDVALAQARVASAPHPANANPSANNAVSSGQPTIRIFNPEAYCELCNKEFCNKYFLKTHKANKHRIYSDPPASQSASLDATVNVPSFSAAVFKRGDTLSPKAGTGAIISAHASAESTEPGAYDDERLEPVSASTITPAPAPGPGPASTATPTPTIGLALESTDADETKESTCLLRNGYVKEEPNATPTPVPAPGSTPAAAAAPEPDEGSLGAGPLPLPLVLPPPRDNLDLSAHRLRRLGIMNPEAFCEICCKEYCNKYFLRTHKMKRHGILIPDDNSKDNQKDFKLELSISNSWYQIQTSPLNLIMGEQNTNSSSSYGDRKSSPANENECEICGMRFQTAYLAQLHAAAAHGGLGAAGGTRADPEPSKQAPDTISEDLQKLQTMILQLNDLDVSRVGVGAGAGASAATALGTACSLCGKEMENRYYLHAHMMTEHGVLLDETTDAANDKTELPASVQESAPETAACKLCGREGLTMEALRQHVAECHAPSSTSAPPPPQGPTTAQNTAPPADTKDDSNGFASPEKTPGRAGGGSGERRVSMTLTPTSSYCEICNKELCNKYFMKTHMQRMHGIEIENGAQIGGVVCNICNKELCSKYFLRVHKHNTHGIVEDGAGGTGAGTGSGAGGGSGASSVPGVMGHLRQPAGETGAEPEATPSSLAPTADPALKPADLSDLSHRYFTHFTEVCTICSRRFRSTKWLKAHLLGDHGKAGADKWNELELQLQQSFGQQQRKAPGGGGGGGSGDRTSPTLRIPNGGQQEPKTGVQNVLSSLFGADDANVKQYHCSFCSFSTPVLAFLFVHERSHSHTHTRPASAGDADQSSGGSGGSAANSTPLQCVVCSQSFRQPEQLHHHIMSQHSFLSLGPFFGGLPQQPPQQFDEPATTPSTPLTPAPAFSPTSDQAEVARCAKCSQCGRGRKQAQARALASLLGADVGAALKEACKLRQLPATYALPQRPPAAKYTMQAFLMDEPAAGEGGGADAASESVLPATSASPPPDRRFAPSIVFLPVLERLTGPLTVSFTLTPA